MLFSVVSDVFHVVRQGFTDVNMGGIIGFMIIPLWILNLKPEAKVETRWLGQCKPLIEKCGVCKSPNIGIPFILHRMGIGFASEGGGLHCMSPLG